MHSTCKLCRARKPATDFYTGNLSRCKPCLSQLSRARYASDPEAYKEAVRRRRARGAEVSMASDARRKDRARGLASDIEASQIVIPDVCPVLGISLVRAKDRPGPGSPSIDRIDPRRGAVAGNWCVISRRANELKGRMTSEEYRKHLAALEATGNATEGHRAVWRYIERHSPFPG